MRSCRTGAIIFNAILFLCVAFVSTAQEKAEEVPHWKGDVSLGLSLARGNTQSSNFSFSFSAGGPVGKNLMWDNKGIYLFAEADDETSAESGLIASRLNWQHTNRLFSYYELQADHDRFKNYSSRFMPAVGLGYKVVAQEAVSLVLDAGLSEVLTNYYDNSASDSYLGLKGGQALIWKISKTSEFNEKAEITGDVSDFGRYFLRLEANLITAITNSWAVKLTVIDTYDSRPVGLGIKENDVVFIAGISSKF
jgi:putative salt-induced outer membrane protein YdiY